MSVMVAFSVTPVGKGESLSEYVARCVRIVEESGLDYQLTPMFTIVEGEWEEVFGVLHRCYEALRHDCPRLSITIKVDAREGQKGRMQRKVASVEEKLGHSVRKG